jgi:hypothetical protein
MLLIAIHENSKKIGFRVWVWILGFYEFMGMNLSLKPNFYGFMSMSFGFQTQTHTRNSNFFEFPCMLIADLQFMAGPKLIFL